MERLVFVLNTYRPSLIYFAKSLTIHLQWTAPEGIANELENDLIEICTSHPQLLIRHFCASRYQAQEEASDIRGHIEEDQTHFTSQERSTLVAFLYKSASKNVFVPDGT